MFLLLSVMLMVAALRPARAQADEQAGRRVLDFATAMKAYDEATAIAARDPDRARLLYESCAQRLESIVASGVQNGRLEFDLGNAFLQAGRVGEAILHYRRAERHVPTHAALAHNLAAARRRCLTYIPPTRTDSILRELFFWHHAVSLRGRIVTALFFYVLAWACVSGRIYRRRRWLWALAAGCAVVSLAVGISAGVSLYTDAHSPAGVILASDVTVYQGPGTGYERQFEQPLQPGVEFTLRERRGQWWQIELPDGQTGYIPATSAGLVQMTHRTMAGSS